MRNYHISVPVLAMAAGIILFLVALQTVMHQFDPSGTADQRDYEPSLRLALSPLAFPTMAAMLFAKPVLKYAGVPLQLLGTVLAIIQVALGLQIIVTGLRGLGLWAAG